MSKARVVVIVLCLMSSLPGISVAWYIDACAGISASTPAELATQGAECMSSGEPTIQSSQLKADSRVINTAYEVLATSHQRTGSSFESQRVLHVFATTWAELRYRDQDAELTEKALFRATGYGRLKVESHPSGAAIYVDDEKWAEPTDNTEWISEGEKKVVLKKEKCKDAEGKVSVHAGGEVIFEKNLDCTN